MEISNQLDGATWATENNVQIEIFEGGANKYEAEQLTTRYECKAIHPEVIEGKQTIKQIENELNRITVMFGGEIINELN